MEGGSSLEEGGSDLISAGAAEARSDVRCVILGLGAEGWGWGLRPPQVVGHIPIGREWTRRVIQRRVVERKQRRMLYGLERILVICSFVEKKKITRYGYLDEWNKST